MQGFENCDQFLNGLDSLWARADSCHRDDVTEKGELQFAKGAFAKLNSEAIHVQLVENCPEDVVMGLDCVCEDEDAIEVDSNPIDSLQTFIDAALEAGARTCQFIRHAYILAYAERCKCGHEFVTVRVHLDLVETFVEAQSQKERTTPSRPYNVYWQWQRVATQNNG